MILSMRMHNIALIEDLSLEFSEGLHVMTGETGAGKSIVVDAVNLGWAKRWKAAGWKKNKTEAAKNPDLWERVLGLLERHDVSFIWVKGHATNAFNNRCDALAVAESKKFR